MKGLMKIIPSVLQYFGPMTAAEIVEKLALRYIETCERIVIMYCGDLVKAETIRVTEINNKCVYAKNGVIE